MREKPYALKKPMTDISTVAGIIALGALAKAAMPVFVE